MMGIIAALKAAENDMKVLLVYPTSSRTQWPRGRFRSQWVPTGLAFLSTALRRGGHEVRVVNRQEQLVNNGMDWDEADASLQSLLGEFRPQMFGLSVTSSMVPESEMMAKWAKEICGEEVSVVFGGPHPTALPEESLRRCSAIDVAVIGEAEKTIVELADNGASKDVAGLVFRQNGGFVRSAPRALESDLDSLGVPDYEQFNMDYHLNPGRWLIRWLEKPALNIRTSRGCSNRCAFCAGHLVAGLGVRYHSIEYVIDRLLQAEGFGAKLIIFEDDTLAVDLNRLTNLCEAIRRRGLHRRLSWQCCMRVDQVTPEILVEVKSAGCIQIEYGFESASDAMLRRISKNTTAELNRRAVRLTHEAGIRVQANILLGLPGETLEDLKANIRFLQWAKPEVFNIACTLPLPGTKVYNDLPQKVRDSLDWNDYAYPSRPPRGVNITAMGQEEFEEFNRKFFKYFVHPGMCAQMLHDTPLHQVGERRRLRKRLLKFVLQHPVRAARLPWRFGAGKKFAKLMR